MKALDSNRNARPTGGDRSWRSDRRRWLARGLVGVLLLAGLPQVRKWLEPPLASEAGVQAYLDGLAGRSVPGLQYVVVGPDGVLFEYAGGWANIGQKRQMTAGTTMMAFSMTKTVTAVAVLQLAEQGLLGLGRRDFLVRIDRAVPPARRWEDDHRCLQRQIRCRPNPTCCRSSPLVDRVPCPA